MVVIGKNVVEFKDFKKNFYNIDFFCGVVSGIELLVCSSIKV